MSHRKIVRAVQEHSEDLRGEIAYLIHEVDAGHKPRLSYVLDLLIRSAAEVDKAPDTTVDTMIERMVSVGYISQDRAAAIQETLMGMNSPRTRKEVLKWMRDHYIPALLTEVEFEIALPDEAYEKDYE